MTIAIHAAARQMALHMRTGVRALSVASRPSTIISSTSISETSLGKRYSVPPVTKSENRRYSTKASFQKDTGFGKQQVSDVKCLDETNMLQVTWKDTAEPSLYPYVFLRDNCRCNKCFLSSSKSRILLLRDLDVQTKPDAVESETGEINITWNDGHVSSWSSEWFWNRRFGEEGLEARKGWLPKPPIKWNNAYIKENLPRYEYSKLMNYDDVLYNWICDMETLGLTVIHETPAQKGMSRKLADRVAYLKNTNYGDIWQVESKQDPSNAAYATVALGLHTDMSFRLYIPGVQMLHCIKQVPTKGGANQFADGFYVAEIMRKERPDLFEVLCNTVIDFSDMGSDFVKFHILARVPTFRLDDSGEVHSVVFSQQHRDSILTMEAEQVKPLYEAMKYYEELLNKPENQIAFKLRPGDFVCFHNHRVLHGRESFEVIGEGERLLEGGYIDWDELHSRRRVLQAELA